MFNTPNNGKGTENEMTTNIKVKRERDTRQPPFARFR